MVSVAQARAVEAVGDRGPEVLCGLMLPMLGGGLWVWPPDSQAVAHNQAITHCALANAFQKPDWCLCVSLLFLLNCFKISKK